MLTQRENYLIAARGGKPEWVPSFTEDACIILPYKFQERDPITNTDFYNIRWITNEFGSMPDQRWRAMTDIHQWRDTIKFPDLDNTDWEQVAKIETAQCTPDKIRIAMLASESIFLIPVSMLGWVDALCAIHEEPEELQALIEALTDYYVKLAQYIAKYYEPDIIIFGDDLAAANGPIISKDIWQTMYKPYFKKICDEIKNAGKIAEFHCCGNCGTWLIDEFIDIGVDIAQLPMPNDELLAAKKKYGNRLVITGGFDRRGPASYPMASEDAVRESVRKAIDDYGRDGALIFWDGGIIGQSEDSKQKIGWVLDELHRYGREIY